MHEDHAEHMSDCKEAVAKLYHFLDGELTTERRAVIQHHLDGCADCIEAFEFEVELRVAIARGCREAVPDSLRSRVFDALSGEGPAATI